ncbi:MAG TPA: S26 family signal peptidase [Candidatus Limnocylindrales bacterium]
MAVAEGSMRPGIEPGDWLLVDPTTTSWPRRGSLVLFREPASDLLVIKRVGGRPDDVVATEFGQLRLTATEAWLVGDAPDSHDSRHYGPVPIERLVGRPWFRYGPPGRIGRLRRG